MKKPTQTTKKVKSVKAWAFMAVTDKNAIPYLISELGSERTILYLKKPKPAPNPFLISKSAPKWNPTQVVITYSLDK